MDGGESFEKFGLDQQRVISKIAIDESDPQRMFVSSMGMPFFKDANSRGIYSTLDGGQTWNQVYSYSDSTGFTDVIINPERPEYVYASAWDRVRRTGYSVVTGYGSAFYMSRDGGQTWTNDLPSLPQGPHCKTGIAICENEPSNVFVLYVAEDYSFGYLYRSRDFGETWEEVPTDDLPEELMYDFGWFFGKMAVNPENADHIFISGVELFETNDGGQNWRRAMPPWFEYEVHADCHEVIFEGSNIYLATDGGAYKRPINGGEYDWQDIENIATNLFYRVAHNPHYSDRVYGGMQDNGTSGGNKNIAQWGRLYGGDGFQPVFNPTDQNHYFLEAQNGNIAYSPDGFFLDAADIGIPEEPRPWDMQYFMSVHNPNVMYTATDYVYKCSDSYAPFWEPISDKLSSADFTATGITESPNGPGLLYACFNDASVWRTLNDGQNWTEISDGLPYRYPTSIKASPSFAPTVYVTFSGYGHYDTQAYVFRSDDLGMSWVDITGDLPAVPANDIFIIPGMDDKVIFIATEVGVYGTIDAGASWSRLGTNMPLVITNDLDYNPITNTLIAGTFGKSILTYELDGLVEPSNTADLAAQTITLSPNPTSGLMTVSIAGNHFSGGCEVFDNKGSLVLKSSMDRSGNIDVSALKAGIYFLRVLTADGVSSTDRFVKL